MKADVMANEVEIHGHCDARFSAVQEAFANNFRNRGELGASFAASMNGKFIIDIWAGYADAARTRPWRGDTLACLYSTTKAITALCALLLVDRGQFDLDAAVARYWPEFAQAGKEDIPARYLLSHQSGLAWFDEQIPVEALFDWERIVDLLAKQKPAWPPGARFCYHAITQGYLVGEVIRRITDRTVGRFFREEIATPLQADCSIGIAKENDPRVAEMIPPAIWQPGNPGYVRTDSLPEMSQQGFLAALGTKTNDISIKE